ncbi:MAG: transcriptional regulator [bacterium]
MTLRRRMMELLQCGWFTLHEMSRELGINEKEVLEHLQHVARSVRPGNSLRIEHCRCLGCGFTFTKRNRLSAPSRCPMCRSERLVPPRFTLMSS